MSPSLTNGVGPPFSHSAERILLRIKDLCRTAVLENLHSSYFYHCAFWSQTGEGSVHGIREYLKLKNVYVEYDSGRVSIPTVRKNLA